MGKHSLAGAGLPLDQQRALKRDRGIDRNAQVFCCHIVFGAGKFHKAQRPDKGPFV